MGLAGLDAGTRDMGTAGDTAAGDTGARDTGAGDTGAGAGDTGARDTGARDTGVGRIDAGADSGSCGVAMPPGSCHRESDCRSAFEACLAPGEFGGCGVCMTPEALCASSADCAGTDVCFFYRPVCSCGGDASECRPRCTATSCGEGESCDMTSGLCGPTSCTAGFACPRHNACRPDSALADPHDCLRDSCTVDGDCGCGSACVDGFCYDALGTCTPLPA